MARIAGIGFIVLGIMSSTGVISLPSDSMSRDGGGMMMPMDMSSSSTGGMKSMDMSSPDMSPSM